MNGMTYFLGRNMEMQDHEVEDPGGIVSEFWGVSACPVGPGKVTYVKVIDASTAGTPQRIFFTVPSTEDNYCRSEHYAKHRVRVRVDGGAWTDWRAGEQELNNLQTAVNGKSVWPSSFEVGEVVEIEHEMCSGWPYDWETIRGNPGLGADPVTPNVGSADIGPPRQVRPMLEFTSKEFGGGLG
jgi:hypothetical protein